MTDEELVKRLREACSLTGYQFYDDAADRLEALTAGLACALAQIKCMYESMREQDYTAYNIGISDATTAAMGTETAPGRFHCPVAGVTHFEGSTYHDGRRDAMRAVEKLSTHAIGPTGLKSE